MPYKRKSIRLSHYDYRNDGAYFVTICTHQRQCLFGRVIDDGVWLSKFGTMMISEWENTAKLRDYVTLDAFVTMPNHIHGIIIIDTESVGAWRAMPKRKHANSPNLKQNHYQQLLVPSNPQQRRLSTNIAIPLGKKSGNVTFTNVSFAMKPS